MYKKSVSDPLEKKSSRIQILTDLGLTLMQSKVYLALAESGPLKVSAISKIAKVARPDVYPILTRLHHEGLVEKILEKPLMYRAVTLNKGLKILLQRRTEKYRKVRAETRLVLKNIGNEIGNNNEGLRDSQFVLIPKGQLVIDRICAAIENAQHSIDLVISWKRFSRGIVSTFTESMEKAWKRNVKVRFIIEKPPKNITAKQLISNTQKNPNVQIRYIPNHPETIFGIYDQKQMFLIVFAKTDLPGSSALWSNNNSMITLAGHRFETLWHTAEKITP